MELIGKDALRFIKKANKAYRNKNTIDFSKEFRIIKKIIKKLKLIK